jgi:hypothetical protein
MRTRLFACGAALPVVLLALAADRMGAWDTSKRSGAVLDLH